MMHFSLRRQRGATLLISLVMLIVLTLFALTGFNLSSVNLKVASNFQQQRFVEASIQQAVEQFVSKADGFLLPASGTYSINGFTVTISTPICNYFATSEGNSVVILAGGGVTGSEDTQWQVRAVATDSIGGATTAIIQGVQVKLLAGGCPPLT
jgi:Tfp pilus assembly protein PilX